MSIRLRLVPVLVCLGACRSNDVTLLRSCTSPTPERNWSDPVVIDTGEYARHPGWISRAPAVLPAGFDPSSMVGRYHMVVVATAGLPPGDEDTVHFGDVTLLATDSVRRNAARQRTTAANEHGPAYIGPVFPLAGYTDSAFTFPGRQNPHNPYTDRRAGSPGALVIFGPEQRDMLITFGAPWNAEFSGTYLQVFQATPTGFVGRWSVARPAMPLDPPHDTTLFPQGYLCAMRLPD